MDGSSEIRATAPRAYMREVQKPPSAVASLTWPQGARVAMLRRDAPLDEMLTLRAQHLRIRERRLNRLFTSMQYGRQYVAP